MQTKGRLLSDGDGPQRSRTLTVRQARANERRAAFLKANTFRTDWVEYAVFGGLLLFLGGVLGDKVEAIIGNNYGRLRYAILGLLLIVAYPNAKRLATLKKVRFEPLFLLAVVCAIGAQARNQVARDLFDLSLFFITYAASALIYARLGLQGSARTMVLVLAAAMIASLALAVALPSIGLSQHGHVMGASEAGSWRGLFLHKNTLGHVAGIAAAVLLFEGKFALGRIGQILAVLCALVCVVFSKSGSSIMIFLFCSSAYLIGRYVKKFWQALGLTVAGFTLFLISDNTDFFSSGLHLLGKNSTLSNRTEIWDYAVGLIRGSPWLGYGPGFTNGVDFQNLLENKFGFGITHVHNAYMNSAINFGIVGAALYWGWVFLGLFMAWTRDIDPDHVRARSIFTMVTVGWLASGLSESQGSQLLSQVAQLGSLATIGLYAVSGWSRTPTGARVEVKARKRFGAGLAEGQGAP